MTKETRMTKSERPSQSAFQCGHSSFELGHSFVIGSFVIRHFNCHINVCR